ncbi:MAG: PadR family transcriptional regulator [Candidatus Marinimicrobia bacterium]|nr:PadR family transcriptional regulator [Candidatus Neomarinimicrobiota bacterium]MCF7828805.1 PadR family transcriptional regulator [Candidatus Neomarinimicrobiota bacterium]MCF7880722.1 PadR family transcriptional regulator [Candidatus Neomarinimicrobiota bacterium]
MVTDLVVLGILNRARRHGYEIKKEIEYEMFNVDIQYGSIYHALKKFTQDGLVEQVEIEPSESGRPDRKGYAITDKGREKFKELFAGALTATNPASNAIDAAIHFVGAVPADNVLGYLTERLEGFRELGKTIREKQSRRTIEILRRNREKKPANLSPEENTLYESDQKLIPFLFRNAVSHQLHLVTAEIRWTEEFIEQFTQKFEIAEKN